jgi:beta-lactamase family protein
MTLLKALLEEIGAEDAALPRDLSKILPTGERHPMDRPLGVLKPRGNSSGLVIRSGEEIGSFGDLETPEVTFSVAKSYLSALAGLALRDGLILNLDEPVAKTVKDGGFSSNQNASITWTHLLHQTSEWEGELFGLPDWLDRGRVVGSGADGGRTVGGSASGVRKLEAPGRFWEYNDVRVNRLSLACCVFLRSRCRTF